MSFAEQRRYVRLPCRQRVKVVLPDGRELAAQSVDISEGGMSVRLDDPLPDEATCVVFVSYLNRAGKARQFSLPCSVRNRLLSSGRYRHGLAFGALTPETSDNLFRFLDLLKSRLPTAEE